MKIVKISLIKQVHYLYGVLIDIMLEMFWWIFLRSASTCNLLFTCI